MIKNRTFASCITVGDSIYAIGGLHQKNPKKPKFEALRHCERYDIIKDEWVKIKKMDKKTYNASLCATNNGR